MDVMEMVVMLVEEIMSIISLMSGFIIENHRLIILISIIAILGSYVIKTIQDGFYLLYEGVVMIMLFLLPTSSEKLEKSLKKVSMMELLKETKEEQNELKRILKELAGEET